MSALPVSENYPAKIAVSQLGVLRSEWTKFRTVRSTLWTLGIAVVLTIGFSALLSAVQAHQYASMSAVDKASFDPLNISLSGLNIAELVLGVLGVLVFSGEYSTGMIRASLTSVPKRLPVLWGKLAVTFAVCISTMLVSAFIAFFLGQALLDTHHLGITLGAPDALRSVVGAALAVSLLAVIGTTFGSLLRNTAAAISTFVAVFFVIPPLLGLLPSAISDNVRPYLPDGAADAMFHAGAGTDNVHQLSFGAGLGVLLGYVAVLVVASAWLLRKRDA